MAMAMPVIVVIVIPASLRLTPNFAGREAHRVHINVRGVGADGR